MKVALLICLVFAASCQANFFDGLKETLQQAGANFVDTFKQVGHCYTDTFNQVGEQAKVVGQGLLDQLKTQGTQLAGQALESLLLGATGALSGSTDGKRQVFVLPEKLKQFIAGKVDEMHEAFNGAVEALQVLGENSHSTKLTELIPVVDELVHTHSSVLNKILHELVEGAEGHFAEALSHIPHHKRNAFTDLLGHVGQNLAAFFQPHVDGLKQVVNALGQGVTQTAAQVQTQAQPHVDSIKTSSAVVLQHGQNALAALKDAVTDILHQTLTNMQPHLTNIAQHAGQLAAQSAGQLATNLGKSVLSALGAANTQPVVDGQTY